MNSEWVEDYCKAVCLPCRKGFPVEQGAGLSMSPDGAYSYVAWQHRFVAVGNPDVDYVMRCDASVLRARVNGHFEWQDSYLKSLAGK